MFAYPPRRQTRRTFRTAQTPAVPKLPDRLHLLGEEHRFAAFCTGGRGRLGAPPGRTCVLAAEAIEATEARAC
jgi:hypothetical protein